MALYPVILAGGFGTRLWPLSRELYPKQFLTLMSGSAGAGLVSVTLSGNGEVRRVKIDPSLADPAEVGVLEDLIAAAANDAQSGLSGLTGISGSRSHRYAFAPDCW